MIGTPAESLSRRRVLSDCNANNANATVVASGQVSKSKEMHCVVCISSEEEDEKEERKLRELEVKFKAEKRKIIERFQNLEKKSRQFGEKSRQFGDKSRQFGDKNG